MNNFGLPQNTYELIKNFLKSFNEVEDVKIFGSRAKGNYKPQSDIDLVLYGEKITEKLMLHIATELDELPTPYKFDIVDYKTISNENFKNSIDKYSINF
ncbi:nucleotidyltransferase domain-containing protein [bacterium]|nr:nucleotidyltransferase domain-containing protein [bacterium]